MGLAIVIRNRLGRARRFHFDDDVARVVIGRDPHRCQVLFAQRVRSVGVEHCAIERTLGRYQLLLNGADAVYLDGEPALDGDVLPARCVLRLGRRGPRLRVFTSHPERALGVSREERRAQGRNRVRDVAAALRVNRIGVAAALVLALLATAGGVQALQGRGGQSRAVVTGESRVIDALLRARASVYRTVVRDEDGLEHPHATAWVVAPGLLATNAHVAQQLEELEKGQTLWVRGPGASPVSAQVRAVRFHPGHAIFEELWDTFGPARGGPERSYERVWAPGFGADVALLEVDADVPLGSPLELAPESDLQALHAGQVLGYAGYPAEQLALSGSPTSQPVPTIQVARVSAVTTFFGNEGAPEENELVQHACLATGGASGSPMLDARGRVVAVLSGGNMAPSWGGRVPLATGINFAQRADFVRELVDGSAEARQVMRTRTWERQMRTLYVSAVQREWDRIRDLALERAREALHLRETTGGDFVAAGQHVLAVPAGVAAPPTSASMTVSVEGHHVLLIGDQGWRTRAKRARFVPVVGEEQELLLQRDRNLPIWTTRFEAAGAGTLELEVDRGERDGSVRVELHRATVRRLTESERIRRLRDARRVDLMRELDTPLELEQVQQESARIEGREWRATFQDLAFGAPGLYLVLVVAEPPIQLHLTVSTTPDGTMLMGPSREAGQTSLVIHTSGAAAGQAFVTSDGGEPDAVLTFVLYRIRR